MKVAYSWIKEYIDCNLSAEEVARLLTDTGLEVEGVEEVEAVKGGLRGVVVGKVLTCEKHPDADRLSVTTVDLGGDEPVQIVCGAPNVAAGQKVPVATVGTELYSGDESFKIKKSKIRGQVSMGMICAEDELGLGKGHDGIMVLDESAQVGQAAAEYFNLSSEIIFEIGLTPNRADGFSHIGVARDLKAALKRKGKDLPLQWPNLDAFKAGTKAPNIKVEVKDADRCPRYMGLTIEGVEVKESPEWLKNRLTSIGLSPINNVVDITNFVLHEMGQPLHAFDADKITSGTVRVQTLPANTPFTTLDEVERKLNEEDLMICNGDEPMCIAGVFGGLHSGVTENTSRVFLESAYFNPVTVRKSAKRHGLNTDASFRFERGVDPDITPKALMRAALLIQELAGGTYDTEVLDLYPQPLKGFDITLTYAKLNGLIGMEIPKETVREILESLDIKVQKEDEHAMQLHVPAYRVDVQREVDVVEEILRIYGYNEVPMSGRIRASLEYSTGVSSEDLYHTLSDQLAAQGFNEIMCNSLTKSGYAEKAGFKAEQAVKLLNPLSQDLDVMRQTMLFGGLESIARNVNRQQGNLALFEFGKTYHRYPNGRSEQQSMALWMAGDYQEESWFQAKTPSNFFHLKGHVLGLLEKLGLELTKETESKSSLFSEGLTLYVGKKAVANLGLIKPQLTKMAEVKVPVHYAELDWAALLQLHGQQKIRFESLSKFPFVRRDLALLLDQSVSYADCKQVVSQTEKNLLQSMQLFDVYEGENLPEGKKSYALSFILQDKEKTLSDKVIEKTMAKIQSQLEKQLGASLR